MAWAGLTLVTDTEIGQYEPSAVNGEWGGTTWPNQRAQAKLELQSWLETDYRQDVGDDVCDRIRDTYSADKIWGYTAAAYTDVTDPASDDTEDDVTLSSILVTVANDRIYIGSLGSFDGLDVKMLDSFNAVTSALTVKYSGPGGWTTMSTVTDGTASSSKTFAQSGRITWTQPANWQRRTLNGSTDAYFWIELSVSVALTSGTAISQLTIIRPPIGLKLVCLLLAMGFIVQSKAAQAPSTDYWIYKARNQFKTGFLDIAESKYAAMRDKGGIPIDLDDDGVIEEAENQVVTPIRLGRA